MGSQHSRTANTGMQAKRGRRPKNGNGNRPQPPAPPPALADPSSNEFNTTKTPSVSETRDLPHKEGTSILTLESRNENLVPTKLRRFRVNVPESMVPGDIMSIKLNGALTKILITTPTTPTTSQRQVVNDKTTAMKDDPKPSSQATSSTISSTASSSSSSSTPASEQQLVEPAKIDSTTVVATTEAKVPDGKMIVHAKPVIVIHGEFSQTDKNLKEAMVDEIMKEIIKETVSNGCNAILGMTVSIKLQKYGWGSGENEGGYIVKACGTPCLLMPTQVLLGSQTACSGPGLRKRTSSSDTTPIVRRQ